jgi:membrane-anchored protein YejM (alkaline phosphatase superfamily)
MNASNPVALLMRFPSEEFNEAVVDNVAQQDRVVAIRVDELNDDRVDVRVIPGLAEIAEYPAIVAELVE